MNKKGFTLVEVIIVLAILSLLLLILVPNIFVLVEKNNVKSCNSLKDNIESAAKMYVTANKYKLGITCYDAANADATTKKITLQTLIDSGDLTPDNSGKIINPINNTEITTDNIVKVTYDCTTKTFTYEVTVIDCTKS